MAGKKGQTALQTKVNTDEEWNAILERPGLVVVDVYSNWSGPCVAMVSTLRKVKIEIGGDLLSYAIAKNDEIAALERFRGKSEPVWMFIQNGEMVNLVFGAHCPNLQRLLLDEIRRIKAEEPPKWSVPVTQRGPEEEQRWKQKEAVRQAIENQKKAAEEAEKKAIYEGFMDQMLFELCEETAILLYPWIFLSEAGNQIDKNSSPPFVELVTEIFPECFDIAEEIRLELDEEIIEKMFVESGVTITEDLLEGLTQGRCMIMRLKGRPPHPDWPVPYPHTCEHDGERCPTRKINDIENYLLHILHEQPPPLISSTRMHFDEPYVKRHIFVHEPDPEIEGDHKQVYPAVWVPPQARSKVHVFKTIFAKYMDKAHPYEEPVAPLPLCGFKFDATKFPTLLEAYQLHKDCVEYFGAFEYDKPQFAKRLGSSPEDFDTKVKYKTGNEVFVVILRRVNNEVFLSFAGIEPYFINENNDEVLGMIDEYFPEGAQDFSVVEQLAKQEMFEEEEEEEDEDEDEEEESEGEEEEQLDTGYGVVDYSLF